MVLKDQSKTFLKLLLVDIFPFLTQVSTWVSCRASSGKQIFILHYESHPVGRNSNLEGSPLHTYIPGYSVVLPHKECMHHSQIWLLIHPEISCIKAGFWIPASFPDLIWIGYWRKKLLLTSSPSLRLEKATIEFSEKMSYCFILLIFLSSSDYHCVVLEIYIRTNILAPIPEISIFFIF